MAFPLGVLRAGPGWGGRSLLASWGGNLAEPSCALSLTPRSGETCLRRGWKLGVPKETMQGLFKQEHPHCLGFLLQPWARVRWGQAFGQYLEHENVSLEP